MRWKPVLFGACFAGVGVSAALAYTGRWWTVDGGGAASKGGNFELVGTIGQSDAGWMVGDPFDLRGGYWAGSATVTSLPGDDGSATPRIPRLSQGSPNPFNPRVNFLLDLPEERRVRMQVYDLRGRLVRTLITEPMPAGRHSVSWDGSDDTGTGVASGVYVVELRAGSYAAQRKVTLVK